MASVQPSSASPEPLYDPVGGALCLDFVNALGDPSDADSGRLDGYGDLVRWAEEGGILDRRQAERLTRRAKDRPAGAERALRAAGELRHLLFRLFAAVADGEEPAASDREALNRELARALGHRELAWVGDSVSWRWSGLEDDPAGLLRPLVWSAADLLTSGELARVRQCALDSCAWLFVDRSRNGRRKWCDMQTCGNRAKARRHYARCKEE